MAQILPVQGVYQGRNHPRTSIVVFPANKGLISGLRPEFIPAEALFQSSNLIHGRDRTRRTRPGIQRYLQTPTILGSRKVQWLQDFWRHNSSTGVKDQNIIAICDNGLWRDSTGTGEFEYISSLTSNDKLISGDVLVGLLLFGVQDSGLYTYNQSTLTNITSSIGAPNTWIVRKHRSRFWTGGDPNNPDVLYYSEPESVNFTTGVSGSINLDLGGPDSTGLSAIFPEFLGRLYVTKENSIYEIDTSISAFPVRPFTSRFGCISHNGVVSVGNDIIFPSLRGLHSLRATANYGDLEDNFVSAPVSDIWEDSIDFTKGQEISATFLPDYDSYVMLYPRRDSENFNLLGYNVNSGDFYLWENYNGTHLTSYIEQTTKAYKLLLGTADGKLGVARQLNDTTYLDIDQPYTSSFRTPPLFPTGAPSGEYQFTYITIFFVPRKGDITFSYSIDGRLSQTLTIEQSNFTQGGGMTYTTLPLNGSGMSISLSFETVPNPISSEAAMEILGYNIECVPSSPDYRSEQLSVG